MQMNSETKERSISYSMANEQENLLKIRTALVSVHDKRGLLQLGEKLVYFGAKIIATGGTLKHLLGGGLPAQSLEDLVRYPEMLDGRVKTLQPEIFAGLLAKRSSDDHLRQLRERNLLTIDMAVCNFYPFVATDSGEHSSIDEVLEMIDIGGPSIVRASAKNFHSVCVVPSPEFYSKVIQELEMNRGYISLNFRKEMAVKAFEQVAAYDISIYNSLQRRLCEGKLFPDSFFLSARTYESPKYGENPNQKAMIYALEGVSGGIPSWSQLAGEPRSYNNYLDIASSYEILEGFEDKPAAATVKHGQISGFAFSVSLADAYSLAHSCDPEADFGNTTIFNRIVDRETALLVGSGASAEEEQIKTSKKDEAIVKNKPEQHQRQPSPVYTEIVIAPDYEPEALEILKSKQKKKIRIIKAGEGSNYRFDVKVKQGVVLVQELQDYRKKLDPSKPTVVTERKPTQIETRIMLHLWELVRRVESNGIVIGNGESSTDGSIRRLWTLGVGSFRKRNGATKIALDNAGERARGAYCASDGFFPFSDSIDLLGKAGVKGVIQPGGSLRDKEVIKAADDYRIAMLFTHERAFKH
jgi:phosphoribosylaminoimidazolecarboxamide formyltransferase/IMP cyclohydrolase